VRRTSCQATEILELIWLPYLLPKRREEGVELVVETTIKPVIYANLLIPEATILAILCLSLRRSLLTEMAGALDTSDRLGCVGAEEQASLHISPDHGNQVSCFAKGGLLRHTPSGI
jgi:hypothetical protein